MAEWRLSPHILRPACGKPPLFTGLKQFDVGTGRGQETHARFDTPTLIEAWRTAPYLHDGRAKTIQEIFLKYNPSDRHGGTSHLTKEQIDDLAEYVLSL